MIAKFVLSPKTAENGELGHKRLNCFVLVRSIREDNGNSNSSSDNISIVTDPLKYTHNVRESLMLLLSRCIATLRMHVWGGGQGAALAEALGENAEVSLS